MRSPLTVIILVLLLFAASIAATTTDAAPFIISCNTTGSVLISNGTYATGIEINGTSSNCNSVSISGIITPFLHFADMNGVGNSSNTMKVDIFSLLFGGDATLIPKTGSGRRAPLAFFGSVNLRHLMVYENVVNYNATEVDSFCFFGSTVSTGPATMDSFHIGGNTWAPAYDPGNAVGTSGYYFLYFAANVGPSLGWSMQMCHNQFIIKVVNTMQIGFLYFGGEVSGTAITLFTNTIHAESTGTTVFEPSIINFQGAVSSPDPAQLKAKSPFLLSLISNDVELRGTAKSGTGATYTISSLVLFASTVQGFSSQQNTANWIYLYDNKFEMHFVAASVIFHVIAFSQGCPCALSTINATANRVLSDFSCGTTSLANFLGVTGAVSLQQISLSGNTWYEQRWGEGDADARWIFLRGLTSDAVTVGTVEMAHNTRRGYMNTSGMGEVSVLWVDVLTVPGHAPRSVSLGSVTLRENSNFPVVDARSSAQVFVALQNVDATISVRLTMQSNFEGSDVQNSTAIFVYLYLAAHVRATVQGPVTLLYNSIDVSRNSCAQAAAQPPLCPGDPPQNPLALHASFISINSNILSFAGPVVLQHNSIKISSSISVDGFSAAPAISMQSIVFSSGVSFLFVEALSISADTLEMSGNTMDIYFAPPSQQMSQTSSSAAAMSTLYSRAPIAALRVVDSRSGGGAVFFGFSIKHMSFAQNSISATCAPCTVSTVIFDVSPSATIQVDTVSVQGSLIALTLPSSEMMNSALLPAAYAVFGSVLSWCLPPAGSESYCCADAASGAGQSPIGPLTAARMDINVDNSTVSIAASSAPSQQFPPSGFTLAAFQLALAAAANYSYGSKVNFNIGVTVPSNWFMYPQFATGSAAWWSSLAQPHIASLFTAGGSGTVSLVYDAGMKVSAGCANFLGNADANNLAPLLALLGMQDKFTDVCVTSSASTTSDDATTSSATSTASSSTSSTTTLTTALGTTSTSVAEATTSTTMTSTPPPVPSPTTTTTTTTNDRIPSSTTTTTTITSTAAATEAPSSPLITTITSSPSISTTTTTPTASEHTTTDGSATSTSVSATSGNGDNGTRSKNGSGAAAAAAADDGPFGRLGTLGGIGVLVGGGVFVMAIGCSVWYKMRRGTSEETPVHSKLLGSDTMSTGAKSRKSQTYFEFGAATDEMVKSDHLFRERSTVNASRTGEAEL